MKSIEEQIISLLSEMPSIGLDEMGAIRLMNRTDQKYVTHMATLLDLLRLMRDSYRVQQIDGHRVGTYATTYYDDAEAHFFRMHQAGHRPRQKVRVRTYVDNNLSFLEIKNKDNHGRTLKNRIGVPSEAAVRQQHAGEDFLFAQTGLTFASLEAQVANSFKRITLVNHQKTERLTIDYDLHFSRPTTGLERTLPGTVIIELKRDSRTQSPVIAMLRELRIMPMGFSKYCVAQALTNEQLHLGCFKPRLAQLHKMALL